MTGLATVDGPVKRLRSAGGDDGAHESDQAAPIGGGRDALCFNRFSYPRQKRVRIVLVKLPFSIDRFGAGFRYACARRGKSARSRRPIPSALRGFRKSCVVSCSRRRAGDQSSLSFSKMSITGIAEKSSKVTSPFGLTHPPFARSTAGLGKSAVREVFRKLHKHAFSHLRSDRHRCRTGASSLYSLSEALHRPPQSARARAPK